MNVYEVEYSYYHQGVCGTKGREKDVIAAESPEDAIEATRKFWSERHGVNFRQDRDSRFTWHQIKELESNIRMVRGREASTT